ncbi:MAG: ArsA-related P-loop ATPase [Acidimicrobiales bacterium]
MDPNRFFASSNMLIVAGKGGVGKTATAATCATAAARTGMSVLLLEIGGRCASAPLFGVSHIGYQPSVVRPGVDGCGPIRARSITPDDALVEWLSQHGFRRIVRRMARSGLLEVIATATPGIKDLLVLGKVRNIEEARVADLMVVDAAAAGHALGFLRAPAAIRDTARAGTIHHQAVEALDLLSDPARTRVMLVTLAEETPVNELIETAFAVEDEIGVTLTPVVVNALLPELAGLDDSLDDVDERGSPTGVSAAAVADLARAAAFRAARTELQTEQVTRLRRALPLHQLHLPQVMTPKVGPGELETLADALISQIEALPDEVDP